MITSPPSPPNPRGAPDPLDPQNLLRDSDHPSIQGMPQGALSGEEAMKMILDLISG